MVGTAMDKYILKQIGKELRKRELVREELPYPIQQALYKLGDVRLAPPKDEQDKTPPNVACRH